MNEPFGNFGLGREVYGSENLCASLKVFLPAFLSIAVSRGLS